MDDLKAAIEINHVALDTANVGKHKFCQFPEQGSAPTTAVDEGALYTKQASGITNLFWRQENNGTEIRMTGSGILAANNGYSFLPGGMLLQWGRINSPGSSGSATFPIQIVTGKQL